MAESAVVLDLDGTLVDSVYLHVVAWDAAFRAHGHEVPMWRIHAAIGMGSDRLIPWLLGHDPEDSSAIADEHTSRFLDRVDALRPTNGARELLDDLDSRQVPFIVATSAGAEERRSLLKALGRADLETTDADDVRSSKPAPHLLDESLEQIADGGREATLVGDSPWDAEAGLRAGLRTIAVRTGGFGDEALRSAGAFEVVDDPRALVGRL